MLARKWIGWSLVLCLVSFSSMAQVRVCDTTRECPASLSCTSDHICENDCGGKLRLKLRNKVVRLGSVCGDCNDGEVACAGPNATRCAGDTSVNVCGGCKVLTKKIGQSCFTDSQKPGRRDCDGVVLRCNEINACGGTEPLIWHGSRSSLPVRIGFVCEDQGGLGVIACRNETEAICINGNRNACGGSGDLTLYGYAISPGSACGACSRGRAVCDANALGGLSCDIESVPTNSCGGCNMYLQGAPGAPCGCSGTWECDGADLVRCNEDPCGR